MTETTQFLVDHGGPVLFAAILTEQLGLPLPGVPWLLAAGALSAAGKLSPFLALAVTVFACLIADFLWFYLGRYGGHRVLGLLCRISLEPDSCVRRTQNTFARYGMRGLVAAKFVPGLSTVAPPLAGMSGISAGRFLFFDGLGSLLYGGAFITLGALFRSQLERVGAALASIGGSALAVVAVLVACYVGFKYFQRQRLLRELKVARITVDELRQKQTAGEPLAILDLRSHAELQRDPSLITGAIHMTVDDVEGRHREIPPGRDIVVYCSCPNEVTSARVAMMLQRKGFTRVRPLLGGIDAWRERNYPTEAPSAAANTSAVGSFPAQKETPLDDLQSA